MDSKKKQVPTANKSNPGNREPTLTRESVKLALENGGSVTYYSKTDRYNMRTQKDYVKRTAILTAPLSTNLLLNAKGKSVSFNSVLEVLRTTSEDLGADYFIVE